MTILTLMLPDSTFNVSSIGIRCGAPIYEIPEEMYTGERILEILLNSKRESSKICHQQPINIERSSTFVVDLDSLKHPDDVKKDGFGRWLYSGSHVQTYLAWKEDGDNLKFEKADTDGGENAFQLRRIHCKHPSNPQFQRLLAFVTGKQLMHTCQGFIQDFVGGGGGT